MGSGLSDIPVRNAVRMAINSAMGGGELERNEGMIRRT